MSYNPYTDDGFHLHDSAFLQHGYDAAEIADPMETVEPVPSSSRTIPSQMDRDMPDTATTQQAQRLNLDWDGHQGELKQRYLQNGEKLDDIRTQMRTKYGFDATAKQYKEKFKSWGWQKNLPHDKAQWMVVKADKRKKEDGKQTVFIYGSQTWTAERARASAKRAKKQKPDQEVEDMDTPGDVSYKTPASLVLSPAAEQGPAREMRSTGQEAIAIRDSSEEVEVERGTDGPNLALRWEGWSRSDLSAIFGAAVNCHHNSQPIEAEKLFLQALDGFRHMLGPTHEETNKVVYTTATFYAENLRMAEADKILEDCSRTHVEHLGLEHRRTQEHISEVVKLLHCWNRETDALAFLTKAKDVLVLDDTGTMTQSQRRRRRQRNSRSRATTALESDTFDDARTMISDGSPASMDYALSVASRGVQAKNSAAEGLLLAIIEQCQRSSLDVTIQTLKAWAELLNLYYTEDTVIGHWHRFRNARQTYDATLANYPWATNKIRSLDVMEALLQLAAVIFRSGQRDEARMMFYAIIRKAEALYDFANERTIWMLISIGLVYQSQLGWAGAKEWFDSALASAMAAYDEEDGIRKSLEEAQRVKHFSYLSDEGRPFRTIFGVSGVCIRPGRLHLW